METESQITHTLIFCCATFIFDYTMHLPRYHFNKIMQSCNVYFHPELDYSLAKILLSLAQPKDAQ